MTERMQLSGVVMRYGIIMMVGRYDVGAKCQLFIPPFSFSLSNKLLNLF